MFASAGWGIFSALSGWLVSKYSIYTAFQLYFALTAFAIIPVCCLKFHAKPHFRQVGCPHPVACLYNLCITGVTLDFQFPSSPQRTFAIIYISNQRLQAVICKHSCCFGGKPKYWAA